VTLSTPFLAGALLGLHEAYTVRPLSSTPPCCSQAIVQVNCGMDGVFG